MNHDDATFYVELNYKLDFGLVGIYAAFLCVRAILRGAP